MNALLVLADLLCATCCVPVIMGLSDKVHPIAAFLGCLYANVVAVPVSLLSLPKSSSISPVERLPLKTLRRTPKLELNCGDVDRFCAPASASRRVDLELRRASFAFFFSRASRYRRAFSAISASLLGDIVASARRGANCGGGRRSVSFRYDMTNASKS